MTDTTTADVIHFLDLMDARGIRVWLDGGWAVDACLGQQTRPHSDLDIVIEQRHLDDAVAMLKERGYGPAYRGDTRPWNFALGDGAGHEVDLHVIVLNETGDGIYGPPEKGELYPAEALSGSGSVARREVACITPEWLVRFHSGYELDANDRADVAALCAKFGIPLPAEYR
ncbi:MAG TPA: aminoglycoside nucleotidyltransferase [Candidatus Dormibacteraeota bacterium]|nr:aminoglycoside nucleotidyltransferase [Candidatus Dormibacteraeota bacterium]